MADAQSEYTFDLSVLDPDTITSSSTPRMWKAAAATLDTNKHTDNRPLSKEVQVSANNSTYLINLSALDPGSASSTLNLDREITRLESEDIGGPSDFTQNLADWINGAQSLKGGVTQDAAGRTTERGASEKSQIEAYRSPNVEDCKTPLPVRQSDTGQSKPNDARAMRQASIEREALGENVLPDSSTPHTSTDWQSLCEELQRKNAKLNQTIETHRNALIEMRRTQEESQAQTTAQAAELRRQLLEWERGSTRSLGDSATLGRQHIISAAKHSTTSELFQIAQVALVDQQKRIDELHSRDGEYRQRQISEAAESKEREQLLREQLQAAQSRASNAERQSHDLQERARGTEALREQLLNDLKSEGQVQQLEAEVGLLKQQADDQRTAHQTELTALRAEYQSVAADVDDWVVDKVKEKDERYAASLARKDKKISDLKAKNDELERIYALCGKELMLAWGREEFGTAQPGEKQRYRYRHAVKGLA